MITPKRKSYHQHPQSFQPKKLRTEEIRNYKVLSPIQIKSTTTNLNNTYFQANFKNKTFNGGKTPSVSCFFKKIKTVSEKCPSKKTCAENGINNVEYRKFDGIRLSEITETKYVDMNEFRDGELINKIYTDDQDGTVVPQVTYGSKCNSQKKNRWLNLNHFTLNGQSQTCSSTSNFRNAVSNNIFASEDQKVNYRSIRARDKFKRNIFSPNIRMNVSNVSRVSRVHSQIGQKNLSPYHNICKDPLSDFSNNTSEKMSSTRFEKTNQGRLQQISRPKLKTNISFELEQSKIINSAKLGSKNVNDENISHLPCVQDDSKLIKCTSAANKIFSLTPEKEEVPIINMNLNVSILDDSKMSPSVNDQNVEGNLDFHSMQSTSFQKIGKISSPLIFLNENQMYNVPQLKKQQTFSEENFCDDFTEHSKIFLDHSTSSKMVTKVNSFENFIGSFTHFENEKVRTNNDLNAFLNSVPLSLRCENDDIGKNNRFNANISIHPKYYFQNEISKSKNQNVIETKKKITIRDESHLSNDETQFKTRLNKNTATSFKEKNINKLIENDKSLIKGLWSSTTEVANNLNKISLEKYFDSCENINLSFETNNFISEGNVNQKMPSKEFVSKLKEKSSIHDTNKNDSSMLYLNSETRFDKIDKKPNFWLEPKSNRVLSETQQKERSFIECTNLQSWRTPQEKVHMKSYDNLIQDFVESGISNPKASKSTYEDEKYNNSFERSLEMYIAHGSVIMNENKETIKYSRNPTCCEKNFINTENPNMCYDNEASYTSKRDTQNHMLHHTYNGQLCKSQNLSEYSADYCRQLEPNLNTVSCFEFDLGNVCEQDMKIECSQFINNNKNYLSSVTLKTSANERVKHTFPDISQIEVQKELEHFGNTQILASGDLRKMLIGATNEKPDLKSTSGHNITHKDPIQIKDDSNDSLVIRSIKKIQKIDIQDHLESINTNTIRNNDVQKSAENITISKLSKNNKNDLRETNKNFIPQSSSVTDVLPEGTFCEILSGELKGISIADHNSGKTTKIHDEGINKKNEIINSKHTGFSQFPIACDLAVSTNVPTAAGEPINHSFSKYDYDLLRKTSSPLLSDLECRNYLKSLINEGITDIKNHSKVSVDDSNTKDHSENSMNNKDMFMATEIKNKKLSLYAPKDPESRKYINNSKYYYADSQEKDVCQFWENISSQNPHFNSENVSHSPKVIDVGDFSELLSQEKSIFTQNFNSVNEKVSQESRSEILNYILSQNFTESNSILRGIFKNMNNFNQKSVKQRNSLHNFNQNSVPLLKLALKMYKQFSTKIILTNVQKVSFSRSTRNKVEVELKDDVNIYKLKEHSTDDSGEIMIVRMNPGSNFLRAENDTFLNTENREADEKILKGFRKIYLDKTFLYNQEDDSFDYSGHDNISVRTKIENIFEKVLEDFASNKAPQLRIRRQTFEDCWIERKRLMLKSDENPRMIKIHFKSVLSQPKFCLMMYVLAKSLELLKNNSKITKREMYYQIKTFVSNQDKVNSAIKAVSCMLSVGPWDLNIIAHKGMVFGDLKITLLSNEIVNCNIPGTLIPHDVDDFVELQSSACFILVVEKESIYYKLLEEDLPNRLVKPFIMITGKGYPDLNTQLFLRKLWMIMSLPVFILTDADPHGVNIMITYRYGSLANAHISHQLTVPKAKWLGVFPSEITKFDAEKQPLTDNEKHVIKNILKTPYMTDNPDIEAELKILLESGHKAGIEGIIKNDTFLSEFYFPMKFYNQALI